MTCESKGETLGLSLGRRKRTSREIPSLFIALLVFSVIAAFRIVPAAYSLYLSFYDAALLLPRRRFVGLANYRRLLEDETLRHALWVTIKYGAGVAVLATALGLLLAAVLRRPGAWSALMRVGFLVPALVPAVVSSLLWAWLYDPYWGPINRGLAAVGLPGPAWLKDPQWALPALVIMGVWREMGLAMLLYLAALGHISPDLEDAAQIDGASRAQRWRYVLLPLLGPATLLNLFTIGLRAFEAFTPIFVMTGGGPAGATATWTFHLYATAFERFQVGYGSAMAVAVGTAAFLLLTFTRGRLPRMRRAALGSPQPETWIHREPHWERAIPS